MNSDGVRTKRLRKYQRNRCYLCGEPFMTPYPKGEPNRKRLNREGFPTVDHVTPKAAGGGLYHNKLLAHAACNWRKADRSPTACELLFLGVVHIRAGVVMSAPTASPAERPARPREALKTPETTTTSCPGMDER